MVLASPNKVKNIPSNLQIKRTAELFWLINVVEKHIILASLRKVKITVLDRRHSWNHMKF